MFRLISRSSFHICHPSFQPIFPHRNLLTLFKSMPFSTDSASDNNTTYNPTTAGNNSNKPGKYYSLHEVEWVRMQDAKDQFKELNESQYYNDSDQQRALFLSRQKGLFRKKELKFKLEYLMKLRDKEMYQQQKVAEFLQLAIKYIEKETQKIAARDGNTEKRHEGSDSVNAATTTTTVTPPLIPPRTLATQELEFVNFLRNFSDLLAYMGVVDSVPWRALLEAVVFMSKKYAFTYSMVQIYANLDMFTKRFSAENSDSFMHKRVIGSSQIVSVFSPKLLLQLLQNMQKAYERLDLEKISNQQAKNQLNNNSNHKEDYLHPKAFVLPLFYASSIIWKVQKASNVMLSGFDMMKIFGSFQPGAQAMMPQLDIGSAISLFYSFATTGSASIELQAAFNQYFLANLKALSGTQSNVYKLIGIWTTIGRGSQELFKGLISTGAIRLPKNQRNLIQQVSPVQLLKLLSVPAQTNIVMDSAFLEELLQEIISSCRSNEAISTLSAFQLEAAYNSLVFMYLFYPETITSNLVNSSFFIAISEQMKTHGVVCGGGQKKESILDLKKIVSTVIAECKNKQQAQQNQQVMEQHQQLTRKQEHLCVKSLNWWLSEVGLADEIHVTVNQKISLYELDILLYSKSLDKAVAIEISGNNYVNIDGSLVGKRQQKDKVLKQAGLEIRYFSVTEDDVFHNHIALSASRKNSKIAIAEGIFRLAEDAFGKTFEKKELEQKQMFVSGSMKSDWKTMQQEGQGNEDSK